MATSTKSFFLIIIFFSTSISPVVFSKPATTSCPISTCANTTIRFPFRLAASTAHHQPLISCEHHDQPPGFMLTCHQKLQNLTTTVVNLPNSGDFLVKNINYRSQTVQILDPGNCLPRRLLQMDGIDLTGGSSFLADLPSNTTLFTCPKGFSLPPSATGLVSSFTHVECLDNKTRSVWASTVNDHNPVNDSIVRTFCQKMGSLMLPSGKRYDALELRWDKPDCKQCETNAGTCTGGVDVGKESSRNGQDDRNVHCLLATSAGGPKTAAKSIQVLKVIAMSIAFPAMTCVVCTGIFFGLLNGRRDSAAQQVAALTPQLQSVVIGLEQSTIESYTTKVVLGESKRVPGLSDGTCSICLSDFDTSESVRWIPECQHCFHVECIDEWLRINGSCPLCRMLPPPPTHGS